jgi:hypothetical protein
LAIEAHPKHSFTMHAAGECVDAANFPLGFFRRGQPPAFQAARRVSVVFFQELVIPDLGDFVNPTIDGKL